MRTTRLALYALLALFTLHGCSCDDEEDPVMPPPCAVLPYGPLEVVEGATGRYDVTLGVGWPASATETWTVTGPATATVTPVPSSRAADITFPAAGDYTVTVRVSSGGTGCDEQTQTVPVTVVPAGSACDGQLSGPAAVLADNPAEYLISLGAGWDTPTGSANYTVTWSQVSGPSAGFEVVREDAVARVSTASLVFNDVGVYRIRATVVDNRPGEEICESLELFIDVTVTRPGSVTVPTGQIDLTVGKPDGLTMFPAIAAAELGTPHAVAIANENGLEVIDLVTQNVIEAARGVSETALENPALGFALLTTGSADRPFASARFGPSGLFMLDWSAEDGTWNAFGQLVEFQRGVFDCVPYLDDSTASLFVRSDGIVESTSRTGEGSTTASAEFSGFSLTGTSEIPISTVGIEPGGTLLALTRGTPGSEDGQVHLWHDAGTGIERREPEGIYVGDAGDDPRRLRTLDGIAVATNFGSDSITILTWDGAGTAAITASPAVGDGPVGVDLLSRDGGGVFALTTGFNDGTYTITEIDGAGAVVSNVTTVLPGGLLQPAHGVWIGDADDSFVISAYGSDALWVGRK